MTTILETILHVSENIQETFTELIKLVLRKTIRPTLNPLGRNYSLYNQSTGRRERGYVGADRADHINKYTYQMVTDTLGWITDNMVVFKISPKSMPKTVIANPNRSSMNFKNFMEWVTARNARGTNVNKKSEFAHICSMTFTDSFNQLGLIGEDIINQTDGLISPQDSARMSTARLRAELFNLERVLVYFITTYPDLYLAFVDMVRLINSESAFNTLSIISLIGTLTIVNWDGVQPVQQQAYINRLGQQFINDFNSNELIAILLKSRTPELILTTSFLYPILKMLYVVFGYNRLVPNLFSQSDPFADPSVVYPPDTIRRYNDKNRGAFIRRVGDQDPNQNTQYHVPYTPDCVPPPEYDYDFIKLFCELYPTITTIMGGYHFPTPCQNLLCIDIPHHYDGLISIPDFLLRFTECAYCSYLEYIDSRQVSNALGARIDTRIRYLKKF